MKKTKEELNYELGQIDLLIDDKQMEIQELIQKKLKLEIDYKNQLENVE